MDTTKKSRRHRIKWPVTTLLALLTMAGYMPQSLHAQVLGSMSGLTNPFSMDIDGDRIYIVDGPVTSIYALSDLHLIKQFGKKGEGPGEFMLQTTINMGCIELEVYPDFLTATSISKFSYFSKDGTFQKEIRTLSSWGSMKPLTQGLVGRGRTSEGGIRYNTLKIYESGLDEGREFVRQRGFISPGAELNPYHFSGPFFYVVADRIFVEYEKDEVRVYDQAGKQIRSIDINQGYRKAAVSARDQEDFHNYLKTEPAWKDHYHNFKPLIKFPDFKPGIKYFYLADGTIYIIRWTGDGDSRDLALFDLKGKLKKNTRAPLVMKDAMMPYPLAFHQGALYQLIEDPEEEGKWQLHKTSL